MVSTNLKPASRNGLDWGSIPHGSTEVESAMQRMEAWLKGAE